MLEILHVWLAQVCNGVINLGVQLLVEKENVTVDILSVSIWIGKEQD